MDVLCTHILVSITVMTTINQHFLPRHKSHDRLFIPHNRQLVVLGRGSSTGRLISSSKAITCHKIANISGYPQKSINFSKTTVSEITVGKGDAGLFSHDVLLE